jgi:hypothetical protein
VAELKAKTKSKEALKYVAVTEILQVRVLSQLLFLMGTVAQLVAC